jgi:hypothetical protein
VYLYQAVDPTGATIDFPLLAKRDAAAAERFGESQKARSGRPERDVGGRALRDDGGVRSAAKEITQGKSHDRASVYGWFIYLPIVFGVVQVALRFIRLVVKRP